MLSTIQNITSPDITNFDSYVPDDPLIFSFILSIMVGPKGTEVEESFDLQVCTPLWLNEKIIDKDFILGKHKLLVFNYNKEQIFLAVEKLFQNVDGNTWDEIAIKLSRVGRWEYEDYQK